MKSFIIKSKNFFTLFSRLGERVEAEIRLLLLCPFCVHVGAGIVAAIIEPRLERLALSRLVKKFVDLAIVNAELDWLASEIPNVWNCKLIIFHAQAYHTLKAQSNLFVYFILFIFLLDRLQDIASNNKYK